MAELLHYKTRKMRGARIAPSKYKLKLTTLYVGYLEAVCKPVYLAQRNEQKEQRRKMFTWKWNMLHKGYWTFFRRLQRAVWCFIYAISISWFSIFFFDFNAHDQTTKKSASTEIFLRFRPPTSIFVLSFEYFFVFSTFVFLVVFFCRTHTHTLFNSFLYVHLKYIGITYWLQ